MRKTISSIDILSLLGFLLRLAASVGAADCLTAQFTSHALREVPAMIDFRQIEMPAHVLIH